MKIIIKKILYIYYCFLNFFIKKKKINFYTDEEVIKMIINEEKSLSRFGDGEFKWIMGVKQNSFEKNSIEISKELLSVLNTKDQRLLLGIPHVFNGNDNYNFNAKYYWMSFMVKYIKKIYNFLDLNKKYADASITRPYIDYKDKETCNYMFENLKKIWKNRNIIIVEGEETRFGIGSDFLNEANNIRRIICPSKNAFRKMDKIINKVKEHYKERDLILIALGPTATIMVSKLLEYNIQSIDIGHADLEYCWYKQKVSKKTKLAGKSCNEAQKGIALDINIEEDLNTYNGQIIDKIL